MAIPWLAVAAFAGTAASAFGSIQSGRVKAGQALQSAELALIDKGLMDTQTKQSAIIRMNQFKNDMSKNTNFLMAQSGRSYDPSIDAFLKSEKDIYATNKKRASVQSYLEQLSQKAEAASLRSQAKNTIKSATVGAVSTLLKGGIAYYDTRPKGTN